MPQKSKDTKTLIFSVAMRLFAESGYNSVSMRAIAGAAGIKVASIYNHYKSKEDLLHACYDFYRENRYRGLKSREEYLPVLQSGTRQEVLEVIAHSFPKAYNKDLMEVLLIIFARIFTDETARELYFGEIAGALSYLNGFFREGVRLGRFSPFNITEVSMALLSLRILSAQSVAIHADDWYTWPEDARSSFRFIAENLVPFIY